MTWNLLTTLQNALPFKISSGRVLDEKLTKYLSEYSSQECKLLMNIVHKAVGDLNAPGFTISEVETKLSTLLISLNTNPRDESGDDVNDNFHVIAQFLKHCHFIQKDYPNHQYIKLSLFRCIEAKSGLRQLRFFNPKIIDFIRPVVSAAAIIVLAFFIFFAFERLLIL